MIKGATSYKDTKFGIIPRSKLVKLEIEGTKKGLEFIYDIIKHEGGDLITPKLVCELHKVSFGWIFPDWAGRYRTVQVTYSGKEAPQYFQIPELMENLCQDLTERLKHIPSKNAENYIIEVVELLAWFQHRFVYIHPFKDYNGRIARMLTILILLRFNLPPIELEAKTKNDRIIYIRALQKADAGDYFLLEDLISKGLMEIMGKI